MTDENKPVAKSHIGIPIGIGIGVIGVIIIGGALVLHAEAKTNKVALSSAPKPVTAEPAVASPYRAERVYVGTLRPWIEASVGPQFVSAYVDTVLVRPGAIVPKGAVIATLDCRNATAASKAIAAQAQAIDARQRAIAHEAARTEGLLDGGFVSPNEAEQKNAQSQAEAAELAASQANLAKSSLDVNDCVLRAPFDGEVATRLIDPGAFVRPGMSLVTVVDRATVRMTGDAPETDFEVVAPNTPVKIHVLSTNADVSATITRRAPSADPGTRTVHFEVDVANANHAIPVDTTGEIHINVGDPVQATAVPISAASTNGNKATVFVIQGDVAKAKTFETLGEKGGSLYFKTSDIAPGSQVVTEGRALLADGDKVAPKVVTAEPRTSSDAVTVPNTPPVKDAK